MTCKEEAIGAEGGVIAPNFVFVEVAPDPRSVQAIFGQSSPPPITLISRHPKSVHICVLKGGQLIAEGIRGGK
ncbi:hypothetical protein L596_002443 [Steinernema carpocapsae]|uniref:Uncharacterized protein n=1 Tax=Steinernema carpocapsae TaxID=34508 RepID=A0A4U8UP71_STECR|nr:hypothetical protein L596_002443 [Steinernema carpocapsae]